MKPILLLIGLLLGSFATDPSLADPEWGIGVLMKKGEFPSEVAIDFPAKGIRYALSPDGPLIGEIWAREGNWDKPMAYGSKGKLHEVERVAVREIGYEGNVLKAFAVSQGRYAVKGSGAGAFIWVDSAAISQKGYEFICWADFLLNNDMNYYPLPAQGLNLRAGAGVAHPVIISMKKGNHCIKFTGKGEGIWMEVNAYSYSGTGLLGVEPGAKKYTGWIKALDDKGFPNVWYATRGC